MEKRETGELELQIGGMTCVRCAAAVEHALKGVPGVAAAEVSYANQRAKLTLNGEGAVRTALEKAVKAAGYHVVEDNAAFRRPGAAGADDPGHRLWGPVPALSVDDGAMFAAPNAHVTHLLHTGWWQLIVSAPVQFLIGWRFYKGAFLSLMNRSPNMDVLVALGTTAAWGIQRLQCFYGRHPSVF